LSGKLLVFSFILNWTCLFFFGEGVAFISMIVGLQIGTILNRRLFSLERQNFEVVGIVEDKKI